MPDNNTLNLMLNSYAISPGTSSAGGFNWINLLAGIFFGIVGIYAFNQGRKERNYKPVILGVALMGYPYFVSNTILLIIIGIALIAALIMWKD